MIQRGLNFSRKIIKRLRNTEPVQHFDFSFHEISGRIREMILDDKPFMIARFGGVELVVVIIEYSKQFDLFNRLNLFYTGILPALNRDPTHLLRLCNNAGFFPEDFKLIGRFSEVNIEAARHLDILGSWDFLYSMEMFLKEKEFPGIKVVSAAFLEPYYHVNPWSEALKGLKVLVVHPFAETINLQYSKREKLFSDKKVLPQFELKTYKAVQSIAGRKVSFHTWFDALNGMIDDISKINFDIAIIGCGAYGFPLSAAIKKMGKKAIHLGGATQLLFGIKGKRWDDREEVRKLYNEHWIRPLPEETPENYFNVEEGCYW